MAGQSSTRRLKKWIVISALAVGRKLGLPILQSATKVSLMKTELVTTLKRKATDIIAAVAKDRSPVLITQHGRPAAYLVDVESFEGLNEKTGCSGKYRPR